MGIIRFVEVIILMIVVMVGVFTLIMVCIFIIVVSLGMKLFGKGEGFMLKIRH